MLLVVPLRVPHSSLISVVLPVAPSVATAMLSLISLIAIVVLLVLTVVESHVLGDLHILALKVRVLFDESLVYFHSKFITLA